MPVKFDTVRAGDTLYVGMRSRMGNVKCSRLSWEPMDVVEVDVTNRRVLVSRNCRREWRSERDLKRYRRSRPEEKR